MFATIGLSMHRALGNWASPDFLQELLLLLAQKLFSECGPRTCASGEAAPLLPLHARPTSDPLNQEPGVGPGICIFLSSPGGCEARPRVGGHSALLLRLAFSSGHLEPPTELSDGASTGGCGPALVRGPWWPCSCDPHTPSGFTLRWGVIPTVELRRLRLRKVKGSICARGVRGGGGVLAKLSALRAQPHPHPAVRDTLSD